MLNQHNSSVWVNRVDVVFIKHSCCLTVLYMLAMSYFGTGLVFTSMFRELLCYFYSKSVKFSCVQVNLTLDEMCTQNKK